MEYISKTINKISIDFYNEISTKIPNFWEILYNQSNKKFLSSLIYNSNTLMSKKIETLILEEQPDYIISTHPFATQICSHLIKRNKTNAKLANIITDYEIHSQWYINHQYINKIFVATDEMKEDLINDGVDPNKIFTSGIPIKPSFFKKYDRKEILKSLELNEKKKTILFFTSKPYNQAKSLIIAIFKKLLLYYTNYNIIILTSRNKEISDIFNEILNEDDYKNLNEDIRILEYSNKIAELMSVSEFIITKPGGLTTTEALISNVPMVMVNFIPGQETANASFIEKQQFGITIKSEDEIDLVLSKLHNDSEFLKNARKINKELCKNNSTKFICNMIYTEIENKTE